MEIGYTMSSPADELPNSPLPRGLDEDLPCPQCQYNLRGLTLPRCPECGFTFNWSDLPSFRAQKGAGETPWWVFAIFVIATGMVLTFTILSGDLGVGLWVPFFLSVIIAIFFGDCA